MHDLDPEILAVPSTLRADMNDIAEQVWTVGEMLLFVAFVAAVLAIVGIYGVVGYSVTRRTREYGIRAALGATPRELMRMVFTSGIQAGPRWNNTWSCIRRDVLCSYGRQPPRSRVREQSK